MKAKKFGINWRAFISLYLVLSLIMMFISGIILYLAPPGRIAHWSNWTLFGFIKEEWQAQHTLFSFIWVISVIFHLIFNWKPLVNYFREKLEKGNKTRRESLLALSLGLIVFWGTFYLIPPFSTVVDFGEFLTESWENEKVEPPIPHAEELKLYELASQMGIGYSKLEKGLSSLGYKIPDSTITLELLAEVFSVAPSNIYNDFRQKLSNKNINLSETSSSSKYVEGSGFGRKKLSEILKENEITWEEGIKRLKLKDIKVNKDSKLKDIANVNGVLPVDIINALELEQK